jgi:hypothetical protein
LTKISSIDNNNNNNNNNNDYDDDGNNNIGAICDSLFIHIISFAQRCNETQAT